MNIINSSLTLLRDYIASHHTLSEEEINDMFEQAKDSLEKEAFLLILTEELSEEEQDIYKEVLSLEGLVDGFGFLSGLRGEEEATRLIENYFSKVVKNFISLKK